jgi:hypothetical protein
MLLLKMVAIELIFFVLLGSRGFHLLRRRWKYCKNLETAAKDEEGGLWWRLPLQ